MQMLYKDVLLVSQTHATDSQGESSS